MLVSAVAATGLAYGFSTVAGDDRSEVRSRGLGGVLSIPQMRKLLAIGFLYVWGLGGVLTYYIPAAKSGGLSATQAAIGFTVVNITAALSRIVWGRLADKSAGTRRIHVLRATGVLAAAAAVVMPIALATGVTTSLLATVALAFGVFGFNGVLYLTAGEIAGADRAGRAVGLASMVVFGWGSLCAPIAGLAIEATGYNAVWVIAAVTGAAGALVATSMLRSTASPGERILGGWESAPSD
jgi:MFS family permease